jgi:hypothetical protein
VISSPSSQSGKCSGSGVGVGVGDGVIVGVGVGVAVGTGVSIAVAVGVGMGAAAQAGRPMARTARNRSTRLLFIMHLLRPDTIGISPLSQDQQGRTFICN